MNPRNLHCFLLIVLFIFMIPELISKPVPSFESKTTTSRGLSLFPNKTRLFLPKNPGNVLLRGKGVEEQSSTPADTATSMKSNGNETSRPNPFLILLPTLPSSPTETTARVHVASHPNRHYEPPKPKTVCMAMSTIPYGVHKVMRWLTRHVYKHRHVSRGFFMELRREMFKSANSELCHNKKYSTWMAYQECALKRNQRLESFIPQYPLQQKVREIRDR